MHFPLSFYVLLVSFLGFGVLTDASPTTDSNGYRLARGLPPLPPRNFGRNVPGYEPTPVQRARASASPSSVAKYSGRLQVRSDNGTTIGYVQDKSGLPVSHGSDLRISIAASSTRKEHLNIVATATALPSPFYVGASSQDSNATIGTGSSSTILFSNVEQTDPLSPPIATSNGYIESAIWALNSTTKELTAQYVNPDGTLPTTFLAYNETGSNLLFVGDANQTSNLVKLFVVT
ncbi:hypothetical protein BT96DRAFT_921752 [Gymnopus androsaceus JB14]|uniref:Uncharacterized protein n=1 Tax=Gymnopus androsaceus JB14 TaxID=1447944 RepID=A0A6A4HHQ4_9AGAR|nr:hypothetical protein BT96DRAFT_921752 [Gymnopus androsaceus JB14]